MLERVFSLKAHGSTAAREVIAGLTTFAAMAYILAVNPLILSQTGIDKGALVTATAIASAVMTIIMAFATNYPIALAPGMGLNAFFTYTICLAKGIPWQAALGFVFYSGLIFLALTVSRLRQRIIEAIPFELKLAITSGIGFFIALIGLENGGVIILNLDVVPKNGAPLVVEASPYLTLGDLGTPAPWLVIVGIILTGILITRRLPGSIVLVILLLTVAGLFIPAADGSGMITKPPGSFFNLPSSLAPSFFKLDLGYFWQHLLTALPLVLSILFVDLFDNMGTLIGVSKRAGLLDEHGNLPKVGRAFMADACAAMFGSTLGTSTVTSYIESAAGVEAGGRTGMTSIVTAICFLLALFLTPLILIIPAVATAPALVVVGAFMMQGLAELDLRDFAKAAPAFITIVMMPFAFSISEGIALGILTYVGIKLGTGKAKEVGALTYILAVLFLLYFLFEH
ncbi:MAG: NCS2 family permease [Verrucomicrobia bacterium]|nr:NCS2 family permease [Verrucomicrobiota bacterium]MBV8481851.1 NCS2 family permease [Verrucomicrobiota bacterium]